MLGFPYNISATAEASNFKIGTLLGFAKAHHKITRRRKDGRGPVLWELPNILRFPFNIYRVAKVSDFKFGAQLGFAKTRDKITPIGKCGHGLGLGKLPKCCSTSMFTQWLKLGTSNLVHSLGLPRPTIKPHPEKKWACSWVSEVPIYLGFPFSISATAALSS